MNKKAIRGKYISLEKIISKNEGGVVLASIIFSRPLPIETIINNCGIIPIKVPKKQFFILILNITGSVLAIKKGIPPINL